MSTFKERLLTNWHLMRIVRLGIGTMMLVMGIQGKDWAMGLFSVFFLYQAVTDTGCCGSRGCSTPPRRGMASPDQARITDTIEYEEIK
jgi:hypothetical protein